jgi:ABC-type nitrate/sulfonate/bicarbonate transport system substrate-binding protein
LRGLLSLASVALAFTGCGSDSAPGARQPIRVAIQPFLGYAPLLIAEAEGFFDAAGLEIEFVKVNRTHEALPALLRGDLDVLPGTAASAVLAAMAKGASLRFVADKGYLPEDGCSTMAVIVRADFPLEQAATRLKRITLSRDAPTRYVIGRALASRGIELDSLETVLLPDGAEIEALRNGAIDATVGGEPWQTRTKRELPIKVWIEAERFSPDHQYSFLIFGDRLLGADRAAGIRFLAAFRQGVARYAEGKTERNLAIIAEQTGEERSILEEACWPAMRATGRINLPALLDYQRWAKARGFIDLEATPEQMWDSTLVAASDSLLRGGADAP